MGGAINHSFIHAHFLLSAYFLTAHTYKCRAYVNSRTSDNFQLKLPNVDHLTCWSGIMSVQM